MEITPFLPYKLLKHSGRVESMLRGETTYPISVEIDLSNVCNHGCPWCSFNGFRQENWVHLPGGRALTLLQELRDVGVQSITFTGGGEPLVHTQAPDIFARATALGLQWGLVTNGRRLDGDRLDAITRGATFVRVSLDAGTAQSHQLLHATSMPEFERILSNMQALRRKAPALTIGASMCIFDVNRHEMALLARRVRDVGANYLEVRPVFATEWRGGGFSNPLSAEMVQEAREALETAKTLNTADFRVIGMIHRFDQVTDRSKPYEKCHIGPLTTVINADGYIYHCCIQRGMPAFRAGSVLNRPFTEVWMNAQQREMQASIDVSKCPPCRYDGYNRLIEEAYVKDGMHAAFV